MEPHTQDGHPSFHETEELWAEMTGRADLMLFGRALNRPGLLAAPN